MTSNPPMISVIIVNFNSGSYLSQCVASLLQDDTVSKEIIVVDNASTDNSMALLTNYPQLRILHNTVNQGFSVANNRGAAIARGKYLLFLNPDCAVKTDTLNQVQQIMEENPDAGMAGCLVRNPDGSIQASCIRNIPNPWNALVRVLRMEKFFPKKLQGLDLAQQPHHLPEKVQAVPAVSGAFMFVRRTAFDDVGPLDENYFLYCEDTDWMCRFAKKSWKILFVPNAEIIHAKGISSRQAPLRVLWYKHTGMIRFCRKFYSEQYFFLFLWFIYLGIGLRFVFLLFITTIQIIYNRLSEKYFSRLFF